ncbi:hypothetical protein [Acidovorax sp. NCPPB 4044]|uniref:hypothetical protein n=1 Tax=Acidovorax sp. NCPPB 4044 TaxID=2940490 RepID=UPI002304C945|nr:hypothetical protein [Acidovorax sp. NCPPB 4044]MDA8523249.1 hypothetical protein [Acidovorax sp. NCPPB 4044]
MRTFASLLVCALAALAGACGAIVLSSEVAAVWYMHRHGIVERRELSEDMGFGMLAAAAALLSAATAMPLSLALGWRLIRRLRHGARPPLRPPED